MIDQAKDQVSGNIHPIQFIDDEPLSHIPVPLARLSSCGMLQLEVLKEVVSVDPPLGRYATIPVQTLRGRGAAPALMLLKLLITRPHRFATKDWLSEQMHGEMEEGAVVRLDTIASYLRGMLCGIENHEEMMDALRLVLVAYIRNGRSSGPGYQLAPYLLLWLDTDALMYTVEQAARLERFGESARPFWERAYVLASRGNYLPDEPYSDWAVEMRDKVEGALRQSVHALYRLSLAGQNDQLGEEQALLLLRTYWQDHKADEDTLRPLMELLRKQERYQEAEAYYQQLVALRKQDDALPDPRTQDIREFLRVQQIRRGSGRADQHALLSLRTASSSNNHSAEQALLVQSSHTACVHTTIAFPMTMLPQTHLGEIVLSDPAVSPGLELAQMIALIEQWYGMALFCSDLQNQLDRKIKALERGTLAYPSEASSLTRRSLLLALAALPIATSTSSRQAYQLSLRLEEFLPQCAASITSCWHLSAGGHLDAIPPIIDAYLPLLIYVVRYSSAYREIAANLVAQCYFLKAILAWHLAGLEQAEAHCIQAMQYSHTAKNINLRLTALNQHALIFYYAKQFSKALAKSEEAAATLQNGHSEPIYPIVQGRVSMYLAAIEAQHRHISL